MSDLRPSKATSGPDGSSIFTKSHNSENYEKVPKSGPKTDHRGGGKIDLVTLFAAELVVCWCQLAQICDFVDPPCEKGAQRPSKSLKKRSRKEKHTENPARKVPKRDAALNMGAQDYARQQKHNRTSQPSGVLPENIRKVSNKGTRGNH